MNRRVPIAELPMLKGARAVLEEFRRPPVSDLPRVSDYRIDELYDALSALGFGRAYQIEDETKRSELVGRLARTEQGPILCRLDAA